jgi:hypothetical protein
MLEAYVNQASGLRVHATSSAPRVVVMASHGDRPSELPLLNDLCTAWTALDYAVVVLDATMAESDDFPGFQQLLESSRQAGLADGNHSIWPILPAASGFEHLCQNEAAMAGGEPPLQHLGRVFRNYEIVLVYASAQNLAAYLPDSGIEPLLAFSPGKMSILSAYQALKQLLLIGRLQPTIVAVMNESERPGLTSGPSMCKSLQDCAMNFLGRHVTSRTVTRGADYDMNPLALRLLESAVSLGRQDPGLTASPHQRQCADNNFVARSH